MAKKIKIQLEFPLWRISLFIWKHGGIIDRKTLKIEKRKERVPIAYRILLKVFLQNSIASIFRLFYQLY